MPRAASSGPGGVEESTVYQAILFDMDGVVVDTDQAVVAFWRSAAQPLGIDLTEEQLQRHVYGRPAGDTLDILFPALSGGERRDVLARMHAAEANGVYREVPGAIHVVQALYAAGIRLALVTSAEPVKIAAVLGQLALVDPFETTVSGLDIQRGKPDPEGYRRAAERLGVLPRRCIVFEDSVSGVQAAVAAGARCIGIARPGREEALLSTGAAETVSDFSSGRVEFPVPNAALRVARLHLGGFTLNLEIGWPARTWSQHPSGRLPPRARW